MAQRIDVIKLEPKAYQAMRVLVDYMDKTQLDPVLRELIEIRASQINGCAYCIEMHATKARELGVTEKKIYALSAWAESPLFTKTEKAALSVTEELTRMKTTGLSEQSYQIALDTFGNHGLAQIIMQIATINAWNRIMVATKKVYSTE